MTVKNHIEQLIKPGESECRVIFMPDNGADVYRGSKSFTSEPVVPETRSPEVFEGLLLACKEAAVEHGGLKSSGVAFYYIDDVMVNVSVIDN
jgi:hypothetical protein